MVQDINIGENKSRAATGNVKKKNEEEKESKKLTGSFIGSLMDVRRVNINMVIV